jgi:ADP-ribose pyrophosphatase YjhB (NUDIX family)
MSWAESYLGQVRTAVGDRGTLLFVGARGVARDQQGRILLIRRADNGHWSLPAGAMELGESITDCAVREVFEETGLRATSLTPFVLHTNPAYTFTNMYGHTYQHFVMTYRIDAWDGELIRETDETIDAAFFAIDALPERASGILDEVLADLATFERTGQLQVK